MTERFRVRLEDGEFLVPVECPHRRGLLDHGRVNLAKGTVTCPLHFSTFDLRTGRRLGGPACGDLDVVRVEAGESPPEPGRRAAVYTSPEKRKAR